MRKLARGLIVLSALVAVAPLAFAQSAQYSWSAQYNRPAIAPQPGTTPAVLQGGPFSTQSACYADVGNAIANYQSTNNVQLTGPTQTFCTCDTPITQQGSQCPGYTAVPTANTCYGNSDNCPAEQICGNNNTCIPGGLSDGAACTQNEQCLNAAGCVGGVCGGASTSTAAGATPGATAAPISFVPLAPIPGLDQTLPTGSAGIAQFLNNLYIYLIGIAVVLAVIEIIWGGLEISTKDSVSKNRNGKARIWQALLGLALVLLPVLVFTIINPNILQLNINMPPLNTNNFTSSGFSSGPSTPATDNGTTQVTSTNVVNNFGNNPCPNNNCSSTYNSVLGSGCPLSDVTLYCLPSQNTPVADEVVQAVGNNIPQTTINCPANTQPYISCVQLN